MTQRVPKHTQRPPRGNREAQIGGDIRAETVALLHELGEDV